MKYTIKALNGRRPQEGNIAGDYITKCQHCGLNWVFIDGDYDEVLEFRGDEMGSLMMHTCRACLNTYYFNAPAEQSTDGTDYPDYHVQDGSVFDEENLPF